MKMVPVEHDTVILGGGWDTQTPTLQLKPGVVRDSLNYECGTLGGYSRISGYERFDGRPSPSSAAYASIYADAFAVTPVVGNTLTGNTSGATGYVFDVDPATFRISITKTTGAFLTSEVLKIGASTVGNRVIPSAQVSVSKSSELAGLAANVYRNDIQAVGGAACTGVARGYVLYNDIVYAWRENTAHTNVLCYKSSATGWVAVPYYNEVYFTSGAGTVAPAEGVTLTKGGVTATIKRVVLQGGAWGTDAWGKFIVTNPAGGNFSAGAATAGAVAVTLGGIQTAITFTVSTGAKFEFDEGNFYASMDTYRVYGCDGANRAFEFDGDVLVPIDTFTPPNLSLDKPKHIAVHKNSLFTTIGASVIYSAPGLPYNYQAVALAGEIGVGQNLTGLRVLPGAQTTAALLVTAKSNTYILYGTGNSSFSLVSYNTGAGALDYTTQNMADTYMMDDRGVVSLKTTLNYGNFDQATLTVQINKFIEQNRSNVSCSSINRRKSQYRLFLTNGYALYVTSINGELSGVMPIAFPTVVYMADEGKYSNGTEASFFCGTDGYLYQLDKGTSFDGTTITAYFTLKYHSASSPRVLKRYRKAAVEISGSGYSVVSFGYSLGYGSPLIQQDNYINYISNSNVPQWDSFVWDNFIWDGQSVLPSECEMTGTGENVAITIRSNSPYYPEHTINSIIIHYSNRRAMR